MFGFEFDLIRTEISYQNIEVKKALYKSVLPLENQNQ